jgi:predicted DNA binding protein
MSHQHAKTSVHPHSFATGPSLVATLAIEPGQEMDCPLFTVDEEVDSLEQNLSFGCDNMERDGQRSAEEGTCNTIIASNADESTDQYMQAAITPGCFCLQFHEVECVPTFERTNQNKVIVTVQIPDRETLKDLIRRVRATGASVSVKSILQSGSESSESIEIDVSEITEKQLEALEAAVETGYYDSPREADLEVLADRLDVSKSAISQRLKAVESRLTRKLVNQMSGQ